MLSKVCSAAVNGIEAYAVEVEVNAGYGDTLIVIVGLPDAAVKESRDRVMTALINSGFNFTFGRTTINLAPADVRKEGPSFDLPIAIGMVAASEQIETDQLENFLMVGELALDGTVRPVKGVLPIALRARQDGRVGLLVPPENAAEAAVVEGLQVIPVRNLREAVGFLEGEVHISPTRVDLRQIFEDDCDDEIDFAEVKGQESVKRALEIARPAATMSCSSALREPQVHAAKRLATILPRLLSRRRSKPPNPQYRGTTQARQALFTRRPFAPRTTPPATPACWREHQPDARRDFPGPPRRSVSDELPEFKRSVLETMRQPLEGGAGDDLARRPHNDLPPQFMLVAAMNPRRRQDAAESRCSPREIQNYLGRVSGRCSTG
jgi:magnesium chelatase family protein